MAFLFPVFSFFANNRYAQIFAGAAAVFLLWKADRWNVRREARKGVREDIAEQMEEQTNERRERAREAVRTTADLNAEQLRERRAADPNNRLGLR